MPTPYTSCRNPCPAPCCAQVYRCLRLTPAAETHALHQAVSRTTDAYALHKLQKPMPCTKLCPGIQKPTPYTSCRNPCPAPSCALDYRCLRLTPAAETHALHQAVPRSTDAYALNQLQKPMPAETHALHQAVPRTTDAYALHQLQKPMPCTKLCPGLQMPTPYTSCRNPCPAPSCAKVYRSPRLTSAAETHCPAPSCALLQVPTPSTSCRNPCPAHKLCTSTGANAFHQLQKPMPRTKLCTCLQKPAPYTSCRNPCPAPSCVQVYRCHRLTPTADTHALHQAVPRSTDAYALRQLQKSMPCTKLCICLQEPTPYTRCRNPCPAPSCAQVYRCQRLTPAAETHVLHQAVYSSTGAHALHQLQKPMPCTKLCICLQEPTPYTHCRNPCPAPVAHALHHLQKPMSGTKLCQGLQKPTPYISCRNPCPAPSCAQVYRCLRLTPTAEIHALRQAVHMSIGPHALHQLQKPTPRTKLCPGIQMPSPNTSCRYPSPAPSCAKVYRSPRLTSAAETHVQHQAVHWTTDAYALHQTQ
ncbi:hypothetical protein NDU88_000613 [Pleurodeles waltl]|uniref:Uncharacterized protein n=1 Tax=Pleurodeles waltl TaxID=8319 RepID=A0AAV7Q7T3_PLEWA|nr:hypothetical protein NDU88_000613 [Pleurodeles waltl]